MAGILYLCATPIGNLEDMTPRAQRMLAEADIIAAEDTRHTLQLLNRFNIKGRLVRYDEHSKERQGAYLLDELLSGKNIVLVSDAGFQRRVMRAHCFRSACLTVFFRRISAQEQKKQAAAAGRMAVSAGYDYFVRSAAQDRTGAAGSAGGLGGQTAGSST